MICFCKSAPMYAKNTATVLLCLTRVTFDATMGTSWLSNNEEARFGVERAENLGFFDYDLWIHLVTL